MQQLIDGVGDEVVQFTAVVVVVVVAILAWWSTNARPDRYRTVLVMRSRSHHPVSVNIRTRSLMLTSIAEHSPAPTPTLNEAAPSLRNNSEETPRDNGRAVPFQEMDSIVDADMAMMDNNRLHFFRRVDSPNNVQSATESTSGESETQDEPESPNNEQMREMDSIVNAMEADVTAGCEFFTRPNASNPTSAILKEGDKDEASSTQVNNNNNDNQNEESVDGNETPLLNPDEQDTRNILIKLKYLNDTLKEVQGNLDELLKDFKMRHFSSELSSESCVRLIFKGRVLCDDGATLGACGLHNQAVVHCLVHPKRTGNQEHINREEMDGHVSHEMLIDREQQERAWDLENMLLTLSSIALTIVWFFRCEYSSMFPTSATLALLSLTVFYSIAIFGLYLSDTFQSDRRPAQHQPQTINDN